MTDNANRHRWPRVQLGEVLTQQRRGVPVDSTTDYRLLGARWYAKGLYIKEAKSGSEIRAEKLYRVEEGDFVYNRLFAWKGSFAVAAAEDGSCHVSNEFPCFTIDRQRVDPMFLWRYFSREPAWNEALGLSFGATPTSRNRLKEANLLGMAIPLPPLSEQRRIVARIESLAAKIDEARSLGSEVHAGITSLVTSMHFWLAGRREVRLADVLHLHEDHEPVVYGRSYPQVGLKSFGGGLFSKPAVGAGDTTYKYFNKLFDGAVVLSQVKGWEGAIAVCPKEHAGRYASPEYRTFQCIPGAGVPGYFRSLVETSWFHSHLADATRGVGARRERVRPDLFLEIRMPMPTAERQVQATRALGNLREMREQRACASAEMEALLPSILDRAFKGEL